MFSWAIAFFVIALIAAVFGFFGLAASAAGIAKIIFVVALIMALISFVAGRRPVVRARFKGAWTPLGRKGMTTL